MPLIELVLGLAALPVAAFLLWKYPIAVALSFVAAAVLSDVTDIGISGFSVGVTIYPLDLGCAALIACCIVVSIRTRSLPRDFCVTALILVGLGVVNFGRGALSFGIKASGNDARLLIYLVLPAAAFASLGTAPRITVQKIVAYLSLASFVFAVIAAARWAGVLAMPDDVWDDGFRDVVRVLPSDYAIVVGQALIGVLGIQLIRGFRLTGFVMTAMFAGLVFALQHRSVWVATIGGIIWLLLRSPRLAKREWLQLLSLTLFMASLVALVPLVASGLWEKAEKLLDSNVKEISQDDSTWAWRMQGYTEAVQRTFSEGLVETAIGPPSGRDLSNAASAASIHIHDRFIHTLAYYGLTGLTVLILWLLSTAARIHRFGSMGFRDREARMDQVILEALLVSTVIYFIPYSGGQLGGLLLGAIWLASTAPQTGSDRFSHYPREVLDYDLPAGLRSS